MWWCRATSAAMTSPQVAFAGDHVRAQILTFRGCVSSGSPINVSAGSALASPSAAVNIPGAVTDVDNCLILAVATHSFDNTDTQSSFWTNASLSDITQILDSASTIGGGSGIMAALGRKATAGTYAATTFGQNMVVSSNQAKMSIALAPGENDFVAETGFFNTQGADVALNRGFILEALTGVFAMTGGDIETTSGFGYVLEAETGFFQTEGAAVTLTQLLGGDWVKDAEAVVDWVKDPPAN